MSRKIAVIAIEHPHYDGLYLHGLRSDDNTWCMPGGHFESGEDNVEAAGRELFEETGLVADLSEVYDHETLDWQGKPLRIFLFIGKNPHGNLTAVNDPDAEFVQFKYINPESDDYKFRTPKERNVLLMWLHDQKLQKSMFEDDLSKVEKPPMVVGEVNNQGNVAVRHHKNPSLLTWQHGPEKQKYFETLVDKNKHHLIGSLPEANRSAMENLVNKVSKDPARHYTMTKNPTGGHDIRLRHIGSLIAGSKASSIVPHPDGTLTISQERHGTTPLVSSWHVNHKGQVTDVSKQHGFQHPEGAMEFTQSLNRSRFGRDFGILPQNPEKISQKLKFITSSADKNIVKSEGEHDNVSHDRRTISSEDSRASHQEVGRHERRREGTLDGLHRGNHSLTKHIILPFAGAPVPPTKSFDSLGSNIRAIVFAKNEHKFPAIIIENPNDFNSIIKKAVEHDCEYVVISSGAKDEILYTKGKNSGKMQVGEDTLVDSPFSIPSKS